MVTNGAGPRGGARPGSERLRTGIAYTVLALIVVVAGVIVWYRATYNIWPGQGADARVHWCARDYQEGGALQAWRQVTAGSGSPVRAEGEYPPLGLTRRELFASTYSSASSCATVIYLRATPQEYQPYTLLGGP